MARLFPSSFPLPDDSSRWAEKVTFEAFATLSDEWSVIYSLRWFGHRDGRSGDGEADFLLLHPRNGLLVVEVKGGSEILVKEGEWFSRSRGELHAIKDPFDQASTSKFALLQWLRKQLPGVSLPKIGHLVVFPSHTQIGDISPAGRRELICDSRDLKDIESALERAAAFLGNQGATSPEVLDAIRQKLRPNTVINLSARQSVESAIHDIELLTAQQEAIMESIHRNPRVLVRGAAGTGKTVLALNSAIRSASEGFKTLLLCFNRPLARHLQGLGAGISNLTIENIDSFATRVVGEMGEDTSDLELLPFQLADIASETSLAYDAIFVDEAQDLKPDWWDAIESLLKDTKTSTLHLFFDSNQNIYEGGGIERFNSSLTVELTINCRNTREIANYVNRLGNLDNPTKAANGPEPLLAKLSRDSSLSEQVSRLVERIVAIYSVRPEEIVILTDTANSRDSLAEELAKSAESSWQNIQVETIHRFKGLESEAVICVLESNGQRTHPDELARLGYIGLSRARVVLGVLGGELTLTKLKPSS